MKDSVVLKCSVSLRNERGVSGATIKPYLFIESTFSFFFFKAENKCADFCLLLAGKEKIVFLHSLSLISVWTFIQAAIRKTF